MVGGGEQCRGTRNMFIGLGALQTRLGLGRWTFVTEMRGLNGDMIWWRQGCYINEVLERRLHLAAATHLIQFIQARM